jgi:alkylation response protein AidB-like acyl-CoA dehydrogenase
MDFEISYEQKAFKKTIRAFAKKEIAPLVDEAEENQKFPVELFPKMASLGYLSINCPEKYGGAGASKMMECDYNEELAFVNLGIARGLAIQAYASYYLLHSGSEMQKEKYLVPAVQGQKLLNYAATEANAGSDRTRIESVATRTEKGFRINGHKMYSTNATIADAFLIEAFTDRSKGLQGLTLFLVDRNTKGVSVSKKYNKLGVRSCEMAEVILEDCVVPEENQVGREGRSQEVRRNVLSPSLAVEAAHAVGLARAAFEASLEYSKIRVQFNRPIGHFQGVSFKLADMAVSIDAARIFAYRVAWMADQKKDCYHEGLIAKLFASEMARRVTEEALQIHGAYGYMMESPIQRYLRDAQMLTIAKGPSNIYRILISRNLGIVADDHYLVTKG